LSFYSKGVQGVALSFVQATNRLERCLVTEKLHHEPEENMNMDQMLHQMQHVESKETEEMEFSRSNLAAIAPH
jgi:hypothetical protein